MGNIQATNPEEIVNADTASIYQIILVDSELGHLSWFGNGFQAINDKHASFFDMKGIRRSNAVDEYYKALEVAKANYKEGNLQLIGLL